MQNTVKNRTEEFSAVNLVYNKSILVTEEVCRILDRRKSHRIKKQLKKTPADRPTLFWGGHVTVNRPFFLVPYIFFLLKIYIKVAIAHFDFYKQTSFIEG